MVQVKQCIYDPTNIAALFGTPAIALPKPPIGYVNNILGITDAMTYGTTPYATATKLIYGANGSSSVFEDAGILPATANYNLPALKKDAKQAIFSTTEDFMVTTDSAATGGDSTINAYIIFEQIQIGS